LHCIQFTLRSNTREYDSRRGFGFFARSVRVKLLLNCYTVAAPQMYRVTQYKPDYLLFSFMFCISTTKHVSMIMYV